MLEMKGIGQNRIVSQMTAAALIKPCGNRKTKRKWIDKKRVSTDMADFFQEIYDKIKTKNPPAPETTLMGKFNESNSIVILSGINWPLRRMVCGPAESYAGTPPS